MEKIYQSSDQKIKYFLSQARKCSDTCTWKITLWKRKADIKGYTHNPNSVNMHMASIKDQKKIQLHSDSLSVNVH